MRKILIGAILASSLAMSGDLEKCSEAIDSKTKYHELFMEVHGKSKMESAEANIYADLYIAWHDKTLKACKGVLSKVGYKHNAENFPSGFDEIRKSRLNK